MKDKTVIVIRGRDSTKDKGKGIKDKIGKAELPFRDLRFRFGVSDDAHKDSFQFAGFLLDAG